PKLRWWVSGYNARADIEMIVQPRSIPITWRAYDVVDLEPLRFTLPRGPFVGALILTLRDEEHHRFAANFVNIVVKPDRPLPRIQGRDAPEVTVRSAPGAFAAQHWSEPVKAPPGKVYGHGKGYFEYRLHLPPAVVKAHPETI